ncbi:PAS/PAC sensor protein [Oceanococcus atlanticus]|uniref:PAS/PAC sensor protein n=1 Tax=Oceanococcus atlanticus TaxID=1317117 RepID=A0A1Y1SHA5_9GAMM|nr:PAS/PAC sensor protein [Oceanococcus atlanticus]RZO82877.1 MAG: hypothetical protein EVA65_16360 [Oceanococcus sp.]
MFATDSHLPDLFHIVEAVLVAVFGAAALWALFRLRRHLQNVTFYFVLAVLLGGALAPVMSLGMSHSTQHMMLGASRVLFAAALFVGCLEVLRITGILNRQLARKQDAERQLTENREHLQRLIMQRTEALRSEISERSKLQESLANYSQMLEKDLQAAAQAQSAMQTELPRCDYVRVAANSFARDQVNGDMFHVDLRANGDLFLMVGDAMGHGAAAGFMTVLARTALKTMNLERTPSQILSELNHLMSEQDSGVYLTAVLARISPNGRCQIAHAGHPSSIILRGHETLEYLRAGGFALGMFDLPGVEYTQQELQLNPGDRVLLYTDGVTEVRNAQGEEYGWDRLDNALRDSDPASVDNALMQVLEHVYDFCGDQPMTDDITLLLAEYTGAESAAR